GITPFNNTVLFYVYAGFPSSTEIWNSNGTATGTVKLFQGAGRFSPLPPQITPVGNIAYFAADDGVHGPELWETDGTPAGTVLNSDLYPGSIGSNPRNLTNVDGTLFFAANDFIHGYELFKVSPMGDQGENRAANAARLASASLAASFSSTVINA